MIAAHWHEMEDFVPVKRSNPTDGLMSPVVGASSKEIIPG